MIRYAAYFLSLTAALLAGPLSIAQPATTGNCQNPRTTGDLSSSQSLQENGKKAFRGVQKDFLDKIGSLAVSTIIDDSQYPAKPGHALTRDPLAGKLIRYCVPVPPAGL